MSWEVVWSYRNALGVLLKASRVEIPAYFFMTSWGICHRVPGQVEGVKKVEFPLF